MPFFRVATLWVGFFSIDFSRETFSKARKRHSRSRKHIFVCNRCLKRDLWQSYFDAYSNYTGYKMYHGKYMEVSVDSVNDEVS